MVHPASQPSSQSPSVRQSVGNLCLSRVIIQRKLRGVRVPTHPWRMGMRMQRRNREEQDVLWNQKQMFLPYLGQRPSMPLPPPFLIYICIHIQFMCPLPPLHPPTPPMQQQQHPRRTTELRSVASTSLHDHKPGHTVYSTCNIWGASWLAGWSG